MDVILMNGEGNCIQMEKNWFLIYREYDIEFIIKIIIMFKVIRFIHPKSKTQRIMAKSWFSTGPSFDISKDYYRTLGVSK